MYDPDEEIHNGFTIFPKIRPNGPLTLYSRNNPFRSEALFQFLLADHRATVNTRVIAPAFAVVNHVIFDNQGRLIFIAVRVGATPRIAGIALARGHNAIRLRAKVEVGAVSH